MQLLYTRWLKRADNWKIELQININRNCVISNSHGSRFVYRSRSISTSCCHRSASSVTIRSSCCGSSASRLVFPAVSVLLIKFLWLVSIEMSGSWKMSRGKSYKMLFSGLNLLSYTPALHLPTHSSSDIHYIQQIRPKNIGAKFPSCRTLRRPHRESSYRSP